MHTTGSSFRAFGFVKGGAHDGLKIRTFTGSGLGPGRHAGVLYRAEHGGFDHRFARPRGYPVEDRRRAGDGNRHLVHAFYRHARVQAADSHRLRSGHHAAVIPDPGGRVRHRAVASQPSAIAGSPPGHRRAADRTRHCGDALYGHGGNAHAAASALRPLAVRLIDRDRGRGSRRGHMESRTAGDKKAARQAGARAEAERMSTLKDEFLATLSHELRTPLNSVLGWAQILLRGAKDEATLRKGLETIERNARAQAQLIEDLLDMSRILSGKMHPNMQTAAPLKIVEAALETVRPAAMAKHIALQAALDADAGPIRADGDRLQQVMGNLLSNAVKFTPNGGKVELSLQKSGDEIVIAVADSGIGIPADFLPHVFDRFRQGDASTTRRYGGLGLGLSIVRSLVEMHGGTVGVVSAGEGKGS